MLTTMLDALIDLVLPRRCIGCGVAGHPLCGRCVPAGSPLVVAGGVVAAVRYDGAVRAALLAYKERGRRDLARALGGLLTAAVRGVCTDGQRAAVALVAVPSQRSAVASRGGDHVLRLARRVSASTGLRVAVDAVYLTRAVRDSAGLGVSARADNMHGAIRARACPDGVAAVLVDDIVTTGATLAECSRALSERGWPVLGAAVIAATPRRRAAGRSAIGTIQPTGLA